MRVEIKENELVMFLEKEIYNEDVLYKCFYWYGNDFTIDISSYSEEIFMVALRSNAATQDLQKTLEKVKQDLIDFKLRDIVTKDTKTIRELIIAKAFAYYELNDSPSTEVSDPVGFNPDEVQ